jgi:hypothetical protein
MNRKKDSGWMEECFDEARSFVLSRFYRVLTMVCNTQNYCFFFYFVHRPDSK